MVRNYYEGDFAKDLQRYFDITISNNEDRIISRILFVAGYFNKNRAFTGLPAQREYLLLDPGLLDSKSNVQIKNYDEITIRNFIFSGIFYFMVLIPQTIKKLYGEETEYDFYACSGWPWVSAGMAGCIPPANMLREADLYPNRNEVDNYKSMLCSVTPFMLNETHRFITGVDRNCLSASAYKRLTERIKTTFPDFMRELEQQSEDFKNSINRSTCSK